MTTNPYSVLGISPNDEIQVIKQKYKQLALKMHPDRGGSTTLFKLLQLSYAKILEEYKLKQIDKAFDQLKSEFEDFKVDQEQTQKRNVNLDFQVDQVNHTDQNDFKKHFNKVFDENKQKNPHDRGYAEMMIKSSKNRDDIKIENSLKNFTIDKFNNVFDGSDSQNLKKISKRNVPTPHSISKELAFTELGVKQINDFSGENKTNNQLHYMDYHVAHSTSKLIDKKYIKTKPDYKSVQDYEKHREEPLKMSDKDSKAYSRYLKQEESRMRQQFENQKKKDQEISDNFQKVNKLMMQYKR